MDPARAQELLTLAQVAIDDACIAGLSSWTRLSATYDAAVCIASVLSRSEVPSWFERDDLLHKLLGRVQLDSNTMADLQVLLGPCRPDAHGGDFVKHEDVDRAVNRVKQMLSQARAQINEPLPEAIAHLRLVWDRRLSCLNHPTAADRLRQAFDSKPRDSPIASSEEPLFKPGLPLLPDEEDELDESGGIMFKATEAATPGGLMTLIFTRTLPHSVLKICEDSTDLEVHPHAPSERRFVRGGDYLDFHLRTASTSAIQSFCWECAPHIERIRRALREPPSDGAEEMFPAADLMAVIAERMGI